MEDGEGTTTVVALRLWQQQLTAGVPAELMDIAREHRRFSELDSDEIDALCERLNTDEGSNAAQIRELARSQYARDGELEIDDNAEVSYAHNHGADQPCHNADPDGAYVAAWVWVTITTQATHTRPYSSQSGASWPHTTRPSSPFRSPLSMVSLTSMSRASGSGAPHPA